MITRRLALFRIGASTAVVTAAAAPAILAPKPQPQPESQESFKHPAEYLAAMEAIGWRAVALYDRLDDGHVRCMGVRETAADREAIQNTWRQFHAIQMRAPSHLSTDSPSDNWWKQVWQYLYDKGLREDVTPEPAHTDEEAA